MLIYIHDIALGGLMNPQQIEIMANDKKETWYEEQERIFLEKEKEQFLCMFGPAQMQETASYLPMDSLTEQKLMSFLQDIMASPDAPKPMVMLTGCIEKGIVTQSSVEFNLCNNPDCKTCRNLEDAFKEQYK